MQVERKILLNPGPSTTTDTVKQAQIVPDICPREKEFGQVMADISRDLVKIVHGKDDDYTAVLFCGSGTIGIDITLNSLLDKGKKALVVQNGSYSKRACEVLDAYGLPYIELKQPIDTPPDLDVVEDALRSNDDIGYVYMTHHETGTGLLNPIREVGALAHNYGAFFITDTTSSYAMIPINIYEDNIDFCMASAQKGIMGMTGLSYVIGRKDIIEKSKDFPVRSYYCNLYMQYHYFETTGQMHFTPPVQTIYAARQALIEYFDEGEEAKWARHLRVMEEIHRGEDELGLKEALKREVQSGLVSAVRYPDDMNWDFDKIHDYCYERGFTIYPGKIEQKGTFRLCALGAIDAGDIEAFWKVFREALEHYKVEIPVRYDG
ncbi:MAG: 2-aminoethylphosphonate aminotransferase [Lachnospiraceae bacterium]|nr:2-aminoethylphosphonate aminotransferase [Lachnospiraceae bacterium]